MPSLLASLHKKRRTSTFAAASLAILVVLNLPAIFFHADYVVTWRGPPLSMYIAKDKGDGLPPAEVRCQPLNLSLGGQDDALFSSWTDNQGNKDLKFRLHKAAVRHPFLMALPDKGLTVVADLIYDTGNFAPEETLVWYNILEKRCREPLPDGRPPLVIDVGVNVGYFSMIALSLGCRVVGVEPQSFLSPFLALSLSIQEERDGWQDRFTLYPCGAGGAMRTLMESSLNTDYGLSFLLPSRLGGSVPVVPLHSIVAEDVLLLKIDTEGFEGRIVEGLGPLLDEHTVENVIIEVKKPNRIKVSNFFRDHGYSSCRQYVERYGEQANSTYSDEEVSRLDFDGLGSCPDKSSDDFFDKLREDFWYRKGPMAPLQPSQQQEPPEPRP